jgi:transcriptional/translational regulatory protein YebC/TACO1
MNKIRRKELANIVAKLEELDALREEIRERLSDILDDEQECLDNMPESLQESERGEQMQEYIDAMENVTGELDLLDIEDLADQLRDICD